MRIAFDLDGTLYDSLPIFVEINNKILKELGYSSITKEDYIRHIQPEDWKKMYSSLGVKENDVTKVISSWITEFGKKESPKLAKNAKELILFIEKKFGVENIYFITNETLKGIRKRFKRDGFMNYINRVRSTFQGKSEELYDLAKSHDSLLVYVGDTISDGEECLKAREKGAKNLAFIVLISNHSINNPKEMLSFVQKNCNFAIASHSLKGIGNLLNLLNKQCNQINN